jgi:radical SAM protein with 4Fe4S-binding SPASM domain
LTLNCNGTIGLCPDETYIRPITSISEIRKSWSTFEIKAREKYFSQLVEELHPLCAKCEFFDLCGGNCEKSLFDDSSSECPLSKKVIRYQKENIGLFKNKLSLAEEKLIELRS